MHRCYFCGMSVGEMRAFGNFSIVCKSCGASGPIQKTREEAVASWENLGEQMDKLHETIQILRQRKVARKKIFRRLKG